MKLITFIQHAAKYPTRYLVVLLTLMMLKFVANIQDSYNTAFSITLE